MAPTAKGWADSAAVARGTYTFYDLCGLHPKLRAHYDAAELAEEREAASLLFMSSTGADEETTAMKAEVLQEWLQLGLLDDAAPLDHSHKAAADWWRARRQETAAAENALPQSTPHDNKVRMHQRMAFNERKRIEDERKNTRYEKEKAEIQERKKDAILRDQRLQHDEYHGTIMHINEAKGTGDIYCAERRCMTTFSLEMVDYGMKKLTNDDEVRFTIGLQGNGTTDRFRERASGVRLAVPRELSIVDIQNFIIDCKKPDVKPEKIIMKILTSQADWRTLVGVLDGRPAKLTATSNISWYDAVMAIVQIACFPPLSEVQYLPVLSRFFRGLQGGSFPNLVLEACKVASDSRDLPHGRELANFVALYRTYATITGRHTDVLQTYYETVIGLMERMIQAHCETSDKPHQAAIMLIKEQCKKIKLDPAERLIFPTIDCFMISPDEQDHPMHCQNMRDTQYLPWDCVYDYVGCHFSLLKADCFSTAVKSIQYRLGNTDFEVPNAGIRDMNYATTMYENIKVVGTALGERNLWLTASFDKPEGFNTFSHLKKGSLVCLMFTRFREPQKIWWAIIPFDDITLTELGLVPLEIVEGDREDFVQCTRRAELLGQSQGFLMFETRIFIDGLRPVLEALCHLRHAETLPFQEALLSGAISRRDHVRQRPGYIPPCYADAFERIVKRMLKRYQYEPGQHKALRWLPNRPILLVQGPPGTGKSFIGCRLVECIAEFRIRMAAGELKNEYNAMDETDAMGMGKAQEAPGPILVLTYKNHSLDEFLVDVLDSGVWCGDLRDPERCACKQPLSRFCCPTCCDRQGHFKKLVRVGSRSQQPRLTQYNLQNRVKPKGSHKGKLKALLGASERLVEDIRRLDNNELDEDLVRRFFSSTQLLRFLKGRPDKEILKVWSEWLETPSGVSKLDKRLLQMREDAKHIVEMNVNPDAIDSMFMKDKKISESIRAEYEAAETKAKELAAQQEESGVGGGGSNLGYVAADAKSLDTLDEEFIRRLKARRCFYSTFLPFQPNGNDLERDATPDDKLNYPTDDSMPKIPFALRTGELLAPQFDKVDDVWGLNLDQRRQLAEYWVARLRDEKVRHVNDIRREFDSLVVIDQYAYNEARLAALQKADIIGLTTTGAAMNQNILRAVKPSVLMVEEAAEILEGQILSCFSESIKQVILIGDHKQLRPGTESRTYAEVNNLDRSMFQRLIETCMVPCAKLTEQRRMKPGIADIVRPIYDDLTDFHTLADRTMPWGDGRVPSIPGMPCEVQFWAHSTPESQSDVGLSVQNNKEVEMVRFMALWLITGKGLAPEQLTILTPYNGQTRAIRKSLKKLGAPYNQLQVLTVDRFQGDENDVIIVSLARTERLTSFLKLENRMCVACSRARFNFFLIGSPGLLEQADHWARTLQIIRDKSDVAISENLRIQRPGSTQTMTLNSLLDEFPDPRLDTTWA